MKRLGRTGVGSDIRADEEAQAAGGATIGGCGSDGHTMKKPGDLENRLTLVCCAICAKPMNWLRVVHDWLVDQSEGTNIHLLKLILRGLSVPCFHAQHLLFAFTYTLIRRQIIRVCRRHSPGRGLNDLGKFGELWLNGPAPSSTYERLRQIAASFQELYNAIEAANVVQHQKILSLEAELTALRERQAARLGHSNTGARERVLTEGEGNREC